MTKELLFSKWHIDIYLKADIEAVIATEIEKAKDQPQPSDKVQISKHTLVEVNRAFRAVKQDRNSYIHKVFSDDGVFDAMEEIRKMFDNYFVEQPQEQPALNPIAQAYEDGKKIRSKRWSNYEWIKKHSKVESITDAGAICKNDWDFYSVPEKWELYTEPTEQPAKPFDKDRFEAMFRAVVASGSYNGKFLSKTKLFLEELDAYYASKEGGANV